MAPETAKEVFVQQIQDLIDPSKPDMHYVQTRTASKGYEMLRNWSEKMRKSEKRAISSHERIYLVVSELKLKIGVQQYSSSMRSRPGCFLSREDVFLHEKDIPELFEKHWALEIDGGYYELVRDDHGRSSFSCDRRVHDYDRHIVARLFIGCTHIRHGPLEDIGKMVISTQSKYELTRDNCHRFARLFSSLALCPNHPNYTIPDMPFTIEESIATRHLDETTGMSGEAEGNTLGISFLWHDEDYQHYASRKIGEGIQWAYYRCAIGSELRRTVRSLEQLHDLDDQQNVRSLNEFSVYQDQTSYFIERDPLSLGDISYCQPVHHNPYLSIIRYDKTIMYHVIPKYTAENKPDGYKPKNSAYGMVRGPYGTRVSNGRVRSLEPLEIIRDHSLVWRNGDGQRLEKPKTTMDRIMADLSDILGSTSRRDFRYRKPYWPLFSTVGIKKVDPLLLLGGIVGTTALYLAVSVDDYDADADKFYEDPDRTLDNMRRRSVNRSPSKLSVPSIQQRCRSASPPRSSRGRRESSAGDHAPTVRPRSVHEVRREDFQDD